MFDQPLLLILGRNQQQKTLLADYCQMRDLNYLLQEFDYAVEETELHDLPVTFVLASETDRADAIKCLENLRKVGVAPVVISDGLSSRSRSVMLSAGAEQVIHGRLDAQVIDDAADDAYYKQRTLTQRVEMEDHSKRLQRLSPRERRIVQMASEGAPNKKIARAVGLSIKSIERIRRDAYRKLRVRSTAEMTRVVVLGSIFMYSDGSELQSA